MLVREVVWGGDAVRGSVFIVLEMPEIPASLIVPVSVGVALEVVVFGLFVLGLCVLKPPVLEPCVFRLLVLEPPVLRPTVLELSALKPSAPMGFGEILNSRNSKCPGLILLGSAKLIYLSMLVSWLFWNMKAVISESIWIGILSGWPVIGFIIGSPVMGSVWVLIVNCMLVSVYSSGCRM